MERLHWSISAVVRKRNIPTNLLELAVHNTKSKPIGKGHVSLAILAANPELDITVQDLPAVIEDSKRSSPAREKISFEAHDMFKPQPRKADIYFFRHVFHDHPDDVCTDIIRPLLHHLTPGLNGTGGRILVAETILQPLEFRPPTGRQAYTMVSML